MDRVSNLSTRKFIPEKFDPESTTSVRNYEISSTEIKQKSLRYSAYSQASSLKTNKQRLFEKINRATKYQTKKMPSMQNTSCLHKFLDKPGSKHKTNNNMSGTPTQEKSGRHSEVMGVDSLVEEIKLDLD